MEAVQQKAMHGVVLNITTFRKDVLQPLQGD